MFSLTSPALLACDKARTAGNRQRVSGIERVPWDTAMRAILAPVSPAALQPLYPGIFRALQRGKVLEDRVCVDDPSRVACQGAG